MSYHTPQREEFRRALLGAMADRDYMIPEAAEAIGVRDDYLRKVIANDPDKSYHMIAPSPKTLERFITAFPELERFRGVCMNTYSTRYPHQAELAGIVKKYLQHHGFEKRAFCRLCGITESLIHRLLGLRKPILVYSADKIKAYLLGKGVISQADIDGGRI